MPVWKRLLRATLITVLVLALLVVFGGGALVLYSMEQNKTVHVSHYTVTDDKIPASFEGKRIVLLGDLHNNDFGDQLPMCVREQQPDIILIVGDWISRYDTDITPALEAAKALTAIAPVYYTAGNHEAWAPMWADLCQGLADCGVHILNSSTVLWMENGEAVQLIGMFDTEYSTHIVRDAAPLIEPELYSIFMLHRPEYGPEAASFGFDLMLSGHTHGGQIRLPLIGAVYAPNQGWFPEYDVGKFEVDGMDLIVTQGLGVSGLMRVLAPPEAVVITLDSPSV